MKIFKGTAPARDRHPADEGEEIEGERLVHGSAEETETACGWLRASRASRTACRHHMCQRLPRYYTPYDALQRPIQARACMAPKTSASITTITVPPEERDFRSNLPKERRGFFCAALYREGEKRENHPVVRARHLFFFSYCSFLLRRPVLVLRRRLSPLRLD